MARRPLLTAFCLAALLGGIAGYVGEAAAGDGLSISSGSGSVAVSGGSERHEQSYDRRDRHEDRRDAREGRREARRDWRDAEDTRRRGHHPLDRVGSRFERRGSFLYFGAKRGGLARNAAYDGIAIDSFDRGDGGGGYYGGGGSAYIEATPFSGRVELGGTTSAQPRIIDIETERLDRRPIGPSGIAVINTGGAKIIRIAPGYGKTTASRDAATQDERTADAGDLQPWSSAWLSYCSRAYRSFDPELGTYVGRDGKARFCQAQ